MFDYYDFENLFLMIVISCTPYKINYFSSLETSFFILIYHSYITLV